MLPLPLGASDLQDQVSLDDTPEVNKTLVHTIETAVIDWARQVRDVLKRDSAQPLVEGLHPGPLVELEFWTVKRLNLQNIQQQLVSPRVELMGRILDEHQSTYARFVMAQV